MKNVRRRLGLSRTLSSLTLMLLLSAMAEAESLPFAPLPLFHGGTLHLADLAGHVVVVRFLASW